MNSTGDNIHEGEALKFYLRLEHGRITNVAKALGYTTNVYMYQMLKMEKLPKSLWVNIETKANIRKVDVMNCLTIMNSPEQTESEIIKLLKHTIEILERENKTLIQILNKKK